MSESRDFLFELGTEELPPKALSNLGESLGLALKAGIEKANISFGGLNIYATPRRLAALVNDLSISQPDAVIERRGPAITAAFDSEGQPTRASLGFASSCGVPVETLETLKTDKGAWLVFRQAQQGQASVDLMPGIIADALTKLPIPKRMRWGALKEEFVRPVHWMVMMYGEEVVEFEMFGVRAGQETRGHRFHHPEKIYIADPSTYVPLLQSEGHVLADFALRRETVRAQVLEVAKSTGGQAVIDDALLDEVTGMVEWPVAISGHFDERFLEVPSEALISAMKSHQKYFHVVNDDGDLMPYFITVSNIESKDVAVVRAGNERVIRPRLTDAAFFWAQDRKQRLIERVDTLKSIVFQSKLGSLYDKVERVSGVAEAVADKLGGNMEWAHRAAHICKCDLLTEMVGEFPELQGTMGRYCAIHDGEVDEVAKAMEEQYMPRFSGDVLPETVTGQALAIADKLDTLIGIFAIGQVPTGDKDPFALRRASLGVLRIIIEQKLDLDLQYVMSKVVEGYNSQANVQIQEDILEQAFNFMMERLRAYYLEHDVSHDVFESVLACRPTNPYDFDRRVQAVTAFRQLPEADSLAAANKRVSNILKKAGENLPDNINSNLLEVDAERELANATTSLADSVSPLMAKRSYQETLKELSTLRATVDNYFDTVMVMVDDEAIRLNRLAQLNKMRELFMQVADISTLQPRES